MTAEEYIVQRIEELEAENKRLNDLIAEKDAEIALMNQDLELIASMAEFTETSSGGYYDITIWKLGGKCLFDRIDGIVKKYEQEE
ncbi:MAG: hypothetical protein KBT03_04645 [Bacteroidales bacterium]|nr:hypothetical protein [Candidatus Scybalousia scybalohippi]